MKPSSPCAHETLSKCRYSSKQDALLYVGRIVAGKGQMAFLRNVNPEVVSPRLHSLDTLIRLVWRVSHWRTAPLRW